MQSAFLYQGPGEAHLPQLSDSVSEEKSSCDDTTGSCKVLAVHSGDLGANGIPSTSVGPTQPARWISQLLRSTFFTTTCDAHRHLRKNECTFFCTTCGTVPHSLCQHCVSAHAGHHLIQIRRYVYCDVIRAIDINPHVDTSGVQNYIINQAKVMFLNHRPHSKPGKPGAPDTCRTCRRHLREGYLFCSLACKVDSLLNGSSAACTASPSGLASPSPTVGCSSKKAACGAGGCGANHSASTVLDAVGSIFTMRRASSFGAAAASLPLSGPSPAKHASLADKQHQKHPKHQAHAQHKHLAFEQQQQEQQKQQLTNVTSVSVPQSPQVSSDSAEDEKPHKRPRLHVHVPAVRQGSNVSQESLPAPPASDTPQAGTPDMAATTHIGVGVTQIGGTQSGDTQFGDTQFGVTQIGSGGSTGSGQLSPQSKRKLCSRRKQAAPCQSPFV